MAKIDNKQYAKALHEITTGLSGQGLKQTITAFAQLLVRHNKLKQADNIIAEFEHYSKQQAGVVDIEITSAAELEKDIVKKIKTVFGKKVEATTKTDKDVLGGILVQTENTIFDASLKTQLNRLKYNLLS